MAKFSDLLPRVVVAAILIALVGGALYLGGLAFRVVVYVAAVIVFYELYRLVAFKFSVVSFAAGLITLSLAFWTENITLTVVLLAIFGLANYLMGFSIKEAFVLISVVVFVAFPAYVAIKLRDESIALLIYVMVCNWSADTFAYFSGKLFGRRRMFPQVSRGKTLEGYVGAIIGSALAGAITGYLVGYSIPVAALGGAYIGLFAQIGDLVESALKREKGVKDSGNLLPGHGGLLDRVDSALLSFPAFWVIKDVFLKFA
ncbi:MAG: phosphatidate cytidylyltransferase [Thermotogae bacterium]|nr:phosphatidate cytidylyltransferase [Thermotogota bacterium]